MRENTNKTNLTSELLSFNEPTPGDFILEHLKDKNWKQEDLADIIDLSVKHVNEIINNKRPLTAETCFLLSKAFNLSPDYWLKHDLRYRLNKFNASPSIDNTITDKAVIYDLMPINELYKKGWIKKGENIQDLQNEIKRFWKVDNFDTKTIEKFPTPNCRKSTNFQESFNEKSLKVWYRQALNCSYKLKVKKYSKPELQQLAYEMHNYTLHRKGVQKFISDLNDVGVKFIKLPHLQKTYLDGAAFMDEDDKYTIAYTARFNRFDNFWWTIAHEIGHILKHISKSNRAIVDSDLLGSGEKSGEEKEADDFAGDVLNKENILKYFEEIGSYITEERIRNFANENNIHPSIVVGVLAYNGISSYAMKTKFNDTIEDKLPNNVCFD